MTRSATADAPEDAGIDELLDAAKVRFPLGRLGTEDEVAQLALHLASDESAWTTGTAITIDGGLSVQ